MNAIRKYRAAERLTLEELGRRVGVTKATVWRWETDTQGIGKEYLTRVHKKTGIPLAKLLAIGPSSERAAG